MVILYQAFLYNNAMLNCDIEVTEFKLRSNYYINFRINNVGKDMKPLIHLSYWLNSITVVVLQD